MIVINNKDDLREYIKGLMAETSKSLNDAEGSKDKAFYRGKMTGLQMALNGIDAWKKNQNE